MNQFCTSLVILVLVIAASSDLNGQEKNKPPKTKNRQALALECELVRLHNKVNLPKASFEKIRIAVAKPLTNATEIAKEFNPFKDQEHQGILNRELADAIHRACVEYVDQLALSRYVEKYQQSLVWADEMGRRNVIVFLDDFLELTPDQIASIDKRLKNNWNCDWNLLANTISFEGHKACKPILDALEENESQPHQITKLLTKTQVEIFGQLERVGEGYMRILQTADKEKSTRLEQESKLFLKRAIESIQELAPLNEKQILRLKIARKGTFLKIKQQRELRKKEYDESTTLWRMSKLMDSSFHEIRNDRIWKQAVARVLPESALKEYHQNESRRNQRRFEVGATFGLSYLSKTKKLSHDETLALYKLITAKMVKENQTTIYQGMFVLFSLTTKELASALEPETIKALEEPLTGAHSWRNRD